ncbi:hypothetical protein ACFV2Q_27400 [Streptomyces sp. NPDC059650]|uniref:hypothetical protein n=1 Tax=Streptomyces sp. NPDC059650 TaxID=3346896 RepID=UPI0036B0A100
MVDFTDLTRISLAGTDAVLYPIFHPALRTFSVQLWVSGEPSGIHGLTDNFRYADEPLEAIDAFLAERDVRALTEDEAVLLCAGLVQAKGGADWLILRHHIDDADLT